MPESSSEIVYQRKFCVLLTSNMPSFSTCCLRVSCTLVLLTANAAYCRGEIYPVETDERLCDILETGKHRQPALLQTWSNQRTCSMGDAVSN